MRQVRADLLCILTHYIVRGPRRAAGGDFPVWEARAWPEITNPTSRRRAEGPKGKGASEVNVVWMKKASRVG